MCDADLWASRRSGPARPCPRFQSVRSWVCSAPATTSSGRGTRNPESTTSAASCDADTVCRWPFAPRVAETQERFMRKPYSRAVSRLTLTACAIAAWAIYAAKYDRTELINPLFNPRNTSSGAGNCASRSHTGYNKSDMRCTSNTGST